MELYLIKLVSLGIVDIKTDVSTHIEKSKQGYNELSNIYLDASLHGLLRNIEIDSTIIQYSSSKS